jgi:hypothetical protein
MLNCVFILVALAFSSSAQAAFQSGNDLLSDLDKKDPLTYAFAMGYVAGVFDAYSVVSHCVTVNGVTQGQVALIAKKYLESHPEELHKPTDVLLQKAFKVVFPCSKKP